MATALMINPSYRDSYGSAKAKIVDPVFPTLSILTTAAMAEQHGHKVELLDLSYLQYDHRMVREKILELKPDVVGITGTTPLMNQMRDISMLAKSISKDILLVGGGAHVSALPTESLKESMLDIAVVGEGDLTFLEIMDGKRPEDIMGIHFRKNGGICNTAPRPFIENIDDLPLPAWHLYNSENYEYRISRLLARRRPLAMIEFSRGCVFKCDFCASKNTMALGYRKKSPARCAEEVRLLYKFGYREFSLADDIFTSDPAWAKAVSEAIIKTGIDITWTCSNGIRVESADAELFTAMRRAGCYRVSFGFETGNDAVLKKFGKGGRASIEKGADAVRLARQAGVETNGYFMLGLSPDTEETMKETIEFARSLPLDMMKFGITIAFPGTPMFQEYRQRGLIRSYNWDDYFIYTEQPLFAHPNLSYEKVQQYVRFAYERAILTNPGFIWRRFVRGLKTNEFFWDLYYFLKFVNTSAVNKATRTAQYFAKDRWPVYNFADQPITCYPVRPATNKLLPEHIYGMTI